MAAVTMTFGGWLIRGGVIYLHTTPAYSQKDSRARPPTACHSTACPPGTDSMRQIPHRSASIVLASLLVTGALALTACKGGNGDAAADGKDPKKKGPEAIP